MVNVAKMQALHFIDEQVGCGLRDVFNALPPERHIA